MKKIAKTVGTLSLVGCAVMTGPLAQADDAGWYAGANMGQSSAKIADARITANLLGFPPTSIADNNRDTGYKLFGGYKLNKYFSLEGGYFNLGKYSFLATTVPGTLSGNIKVDGVNLDGVGMLPITEKLSVFGRLGMDYASTKDNFSNTGALPVPTNPNPSKSELNPKFGLGFQYDLTPTVGMRLEAERYRVNDAVGNRGNIDLLSLGLVYRFGVKAPAPKKVAAAPVVKTVAVIPPPPKPVIAPPPPAPKKVVFSEDSSTGSLFAFGKTSVSPTGKQALDKFAADLKGSNYEVITVTGHTDRIGSPTSNMALSKHRAEAVTAYLTESAGIPSDKIKAVGMGESAPVTKPGECKGKYASKKLIACLAPDRRVEVEVAATRTSE